MSGSSQLRPRRLSRALGAVLLATAVLVGVVLVVARPWRSDASASTHLHPASVQSLDLPGTAPVAGTADASPSDPVAPAAGAAGSAAAAVSAYLRARSVADPAGSYALLSPASRSRYPTEATWVDALPDLLAPQDFSVVSEKPVGNGTDVSVDVTRTAALDVFAGFIPGRALEVYRATKVGSGWRVDAEPLQVVPKLMSDKGAAADVNAWLERLAACDMSGATALQATSGLLGDDSLPATICAEHAHLRAGPAQPMAGTSATAPFVAAYGQDIGVWARTVPVSGAGKKLLVAVAPLGFAWRVFGIVPGGTD